MRRLPGQAATIAARLLRWCATLAITLAVLAAVLTTALAWRLSQGPLELRWVVTRIEAMANAPDSPTRLTVGGAALSWEGFQRGLESPLDLRLSDIAVSDRGGRRRVEIPHAHLLLSFRHLLLFRVVPKGIAIDGARFTVTRSHDGTLSLDLGSLNETTEGLGKGGSSQRGSTQGDASPRPDGNPLPDVAEILRELADPMPDSSGSDFYTRLQTVRIRGAAITILDHRAKTTWTVPKAEIDLRRRPGGGVDAQGMLMLALGAEEATLSMTGTLHPGQGGASLAIRLTPLRPATLARAVPGLDALNALDAPVRIGAEIVIDPGLRARTGSLVVDVDPGQIRLGDGSVPLSGAALAASIQGETITLDSLRVDLRARHDGPPTTLRASGTIRRGAERFAAAVTLGFDQVLFADLPLLWPKTAAPDARDWILENIPTGMGRNAEIRLELGGRSDLSGIAVTGLSGGLDGEEVEVHWLRPVPPMERARARLNFLDHDSLEILITAGRQRGGARGGYLTTTGGRMVITGLSQKDQFAAIEADVASPVAAAVGLLREPRLGLLAKRKIDLKDPSGDATFRMAIRFPLEKELEVEDLEVKVTARLTKLRLAGIVAGRDIDQGEIDLEATKADLTIKGRALLAGIGVGVDGMMDFRDGPSTQVQQRVTITGKATARQLAAAGLDGEDWLDGGVSGTATWAERRNGSADVIVQADLSEAILVVPPANWRKPAGVPAKGSGRVVIVKDQMRQIDRVTVDGTDLSFRGTIECTDGRISGIRIERATFGRSDVLGTVRFATGRPTAITLSGPALDVGAKLRQKEPPPDRQAPPAAAWTLDSQFDRVYLAHGKVASHVIAQGQFDGRIYPALTVAGRLATDRGFRLDISGPSGQRRLAVNAEDAGALLLGLDLVKTLEGGTLAVTGTFDDRRPDHMLNGSARITDFRVRGSVGMAKLLQAMTLYGLVDVLRGPGIGFSELVAPFRMDQNQIVLDNARAFSPSLGLTAKGQLQPHDDRIDMEGTIVPAYFFNSLLGSIPLVGKLFSPETGGGVFAARYTVRGALDDPTVFVNPLSALTPGFLREIFGIF